MERAGWRVTCPSDTDDGECGAVLLVRSEDFGGDVVCRACRTQWPVGAPAQGRGVLKARQELWLDPEAASEGSPHSCDCCGVGLRLVGFNA